MSALSSHLQPREAPTLIHSFGGVKDLQKIDIVRHLIWYVIQSVLRIVLREYDLRELFNSENEAYQAFRVLQGNASLLTSSLVMDAAAGMMVSCQAMLHFLVFRTFSV